MQTPVYTVSITVGGSSQTTETKIGNCLPQSIITRQSGQLVATFLDAAGAAFDMSGLADLDLFAKPFNSAEVPVNMGTGVISGAGSNIYTVTWVRDLIPAGWSSFAEDRDGTIVLYLQLQETGTLDYYQWSTRVNVEDGDYVGDASVLPLVNLIFYYNPMWGYNNTITDADPGAGLFRLNNAALASVTEMYIADDNQSSVDLSAMVQSLGVGANLYLSNPNVKTDSACYTVSGAIVNNTGYSTIPLTFKDSGTSAFTSGTIISFSFISMGTGNVVGPASAVDENIAIFDGITGELIKDGLINKSAITANTAKVTNATHTGDATGATALTLATVNGNVGSFTNADVTVNAKGLITAVSNGSGGAGDMAAATYDPATIAEQLVGLVATQTLTNKTVNGVILNAAGASTAFLNETGAYSTPAGGGDFVGPASSTDNAIMRFDSTTGKLGQNSGILIDDSDNMTGIGTIGSTGRQTTTGDLHLNASTTETRYLLVGNTRAGDGISRFELHSEGGGGVSTRLDRGAGANGAAQFTNWGTGDLRFIQNGAAPIEFWTSNTLRMSITSGGDLELGGVLIDTYVAAGTDNNQTGTAYTLVLADEENKTVWMSNASANVLTIPTNASVAFAVGTKINVIMEAAGVTTITGDTGVTVNGTSAGSAVINNRYQGATLTKRATNTWIVSGDIT